MATGEITHIEFPADDPERAKRFGTTITEEPADQPWVERVARVRDPDGNEVIVGQRAPR
jgi:predicted enzyme related to lactoylglutathione lyase